MKSQTTNDGHPHNIREAVSERINTMLKVLLSKLEDNLIVVWLMTKNTLTVVVMALIVFSPMIAWPFLMGWPEPYCYIAYAIWIGWFLGSLILAGVVGYLREASGEKR